MFERKGDIPDADFGFLVPAQCHECKAGINTRHLDGCTWQFHEEWVSERAVRNEADD